MSSNRRIKIVLNSPVVLGFAAACFAATLLGVISGGTITQAFFMTYRSSLTNPMTYVRLFTHVLGHAGWEHFIGNMTYLLLIGPLLEEKYGQSSILETIVITALVTGLVNFIFFPGVALCGASGVVFAFILLGSFTSFRHGEIPITFILVAVIYLGQQVLQGLFTVDNISNMAHIVGGIVGAVIGYKLNRKG